MAGSSTVRIANGDPKPPLKKDLFDVDDSDSGTDDDQEDGGATLEPPASEFKINEEYARRFEHNKKREERHRLEEKYKSENPGGKIKTAGSGSDSSSDDESEDDQGLLMTEDLDAEISATLQAIKNKDPRIYDKSAVFYKPFDPEAAAAAESRDHKEKPVHLKDYHRERYLNGAVDGDSEDETAPSRPPKTFVQEQEDIKQSILSEINAAAATGAEYEDWSGDETFMKPKEKQQQQQQQGVSEGGLHPSRAANLKLTESDIVSADKDPEEFLNKFMASRAWAEGEGSKWEAFESDDGEDNDNNLAEEFEHAYNMRFEDPEKSNEVLKSYSRNLVAERSVRKEELTGRKKQRQLEKERKEAEKKEREQERRRLRKLKLEEAQEKLEKIKKAAGMSGKTLREEEWARFLDDAWDNDRWEEEMTRKFGDAYYAEEDQVSESEGEAGDSSTKRKKKPKKPKWDDDIDVKDIIPDFDDESKQPDIALTDSDEETQQNKIGDADGNDDGEDEEEDEEERPAKKRKTSKEIRKDKAAVKRQARRELAQLEALVDTKMELDDPRALTAPSSSKSRSIPAFRYRETSPTSFGMTARDILLAPSDAALNEFAGLKKLAAFRDTERKRRDKKHLGKKARLREWRREVFGRQYERTGPTFGFADDQDAVAAENSERHGKRGKGKEKAEGEQSNSQEGNVVDGERKKKRKRSKGKKKAGKA